MKMTSLIFNLVTASYLIGCGAQDLESLNKKEDPNSPLSSSKKTPTKREVGLLLEGINDRSFSLDNQVDGLFFGKLTLSFISFRSEDSRFPQIDLGESSPKLINGVYSCQNDLVSSNGVAEVDFCQEGNLKAAFRELKEYSLDMIRLSIDGIGLVSNDRIFIKNNTRIWSIEGNESIKDLPVTKVDRAESSLNLVYVRDDWFSEPFQIVYDGMAAGRGKDPIVSSSIPLSQSEKELIKKQRYGFTTENVQDSREQNSYLMNIYFVPMKHYYLARPSSEDDKQKQNINSKDMIYINQNNKMIVQMNLNQVVTSESRLEESNPSFEFKKINNIPFGTKLKVEKNDEK